MGKGKPAIFTRPSAKLRTPKPVFERIKIPLILLAYIGISVFFFNPQG